MYIVQVAAEIAPVAKVGGLADVMMGLGRELIAKGHQVDLVVPKYDCLETEKCRFESSQRGILSYFQGEWYDTTSWNAIVDNDLKVHFIEPHHKNRFFERGMIYGCPDDIDRFLAFSRMVLDWLVSQKKVPDVIHIHDWQTAPIAFLIRQEAFAKHFKKTRVVLTIHNIAYQGLCRAEDIEKIGISSSDVLEKIRNEWGTDLNLLKGGIVYADAIVTVSPNYAKEVLTPEGGKGLHTVLQQHQSRFYGILNGIDYSYWNPQKDPYIPFNYSAKQIAEKRKNRIALSEALQMPYSDSQPLAVSICRLVQQKGVELIKHAIQHAQQKGMQYVVLGTAPEPAIESEFLALSHAMAQDAHVRILLLQEEELAHRLYAASDLFLMPSMFEPCGLTQLIALKYGSIPVVRHTGGLVDTIFDVDNSHRPFKETNGYSFDAPDSVGLDSALDRALVLWKTDKARWHKLMQQAMNHDFSWSTSAEKYVDIYETAKT